jgi:cytochrome P450
VQSDEYFKNPLKFDPDRWERDDNGTELIGSIELIFLNFIIKCFFFLLFFYELFLDPYSVLAFGFGARMCIGRRTAEQEIFLTIIKVITTKKIIKKQINKN